MFDRVPVRLFRPNKTNAILEFKALKAKQVLK